MKKIKIISKEEDNYKDDISRIIGALAIYGYEATPNQARTLWETYSETMAAGWMRLPDNSYEIYSCVVSYFEEDVRYNCTGCDITTNKEFKYCHECGYRMEESK